MLYTVSVFRAYLLVVDLHSRTHIVYPNSPDVIVEFIKNGRFSKYTQTDTSMSHCRYRTSNLWVLGGGAPSVKTAWANLTATSTVAQLIARSLYWAVAAETR